MKKLNEFRNKKKEKVWRMWEDIKFNAPIYYTKKWTLNVSRSGATLIRLPSALFFFLFFLL